MNATQFFSEILPILLSGGAGAAIFWAATIRTRISKEKFEGVTSMVDGFLKQLDEMQKRIVDYSDQLSTMQQTLLSIKKERDQALDEVSRLKTRVAELEEKVRHYESDRTNLAAQTDAAAALRPGRKKAGRPAKTDVGS